MVLRKSFYIRWSAGRSPRVHEVNPGRDPSQTLGKVGAKTSKEARRHPIIERIGMVSKVERSD